jgi:hypothetical protein
LTALSRLGRRIDDATVSIRRKRPLALLRSCLIPLAQNETTECD